MEFPEGLKYSKEHEWVLVEGQTATIGITEFAQEELGDIVFVELPEVGEKVVKDDPFGAVESVKAVAGMTYVVHRYTTLDTLLFEERQGPSCVALLLPPAAAQL